MADLRLIYGFHAVTSRIRQNPDGVLEIYLQEQRNDPRMRDLIKLAGTNGVRIIPVDAKRLDGMAGNARHQGVAARVHSPPPPPPLSQIPDTPLPKGGWGGFLHAAQNRSWCFPYPP